MLSFRRRFRVQIQLQDILALVVGYAMAAVFFRAFWPIAIPAILRRYPFCFTYGSVWR